MSMQPGAQSARASDHAPMDDAKPLRIADATVRAVNKVGALTSNEIEKTADEVMRGAAEVAERLGQLADAIRHHSQIASEEVADFCGRATSVFEAIIELQDSLLQGKREVEASDADDEPLPLPKFIKSAPVEPDGREL